MSDSTASLRRKIDSAGDLQSVVRTMKAMAASSIGQYEKSVRALGDYYRTVELGLSACIREGALGHSAVERNAPAKAKTVSAIVFRIDQGLVGRFNDAVADHAIKILASLPGKARVWAVGERVRARLADANVQLGGLFAVPSSVQAITPLVGQIQLEGEARRGEATICGYSTTARCRAHQYGLSAGDCCLSTPNGVRDWRRLVGRPAIGRKSWAAPPRRMRTLVREYLFISLFRACAESLASENASRLAAMERADKNINELLEQLHGTFHRLRQAGIDEELFDVVSGFEALIGSQQQ